MTAVPIDHSARRRHEPLHRRTLAPVRRNSRPAGGEQWPHFNWNQGRRLLLALRLHSEKQRRHGERTGAAPREAGDPGGISFGAIRLAEVLVSIAANNRGRLEPSVRWLAKALNVPMKSIHAWKDQLKRHGFLNWRRRWVESGKQGPRGQLVEQTSNAYWLSIPPEAAAAAEKLKPPPPDDRPKAAASPELQAALDKAQAAAERRTADKAGLFGCRRIT